MTRNLWKYCIYQGIWATLDWLFPPVCGGCGSEGTRWCIECQKRVQVISDPICDVCGLPQARSGLCNRCKQGQSSFKQQRSWVVFENPAQNALHRLKYRRDIGLGEALSDQMSGFVK